jgi:hypothetical protein
MSCEIGLRSKGCDPKLGQHAASPFATPLCNPYAGPVTAGAPWRGKEAGTGRPRFGRAIGPIPRLPFPTSPKKRALARVAALETAKERLIRLT